MKWILPSFPSEVSELIDLPDIGELLLMPSFMEVTPETFFEHGTDFQKWLFNQVPLKNDKKAVTIRWEFHLIHEGFKNYVGTNCESKWHIDVADDNDFKEPSERSFILFAPCRTLPEFNFNSIEIESPDDETAEDFSNRINENPDSFNVVGKKIEPARIYTFENHLHRTPEPVRTEFRFFMRVRETNDPQIYFNRPLNRTTLVENNSGNIYGNIERGNNRINIYYPHSQKM